MKVTMDIINATTLSTSRLAVNRYSFPFTTIPNHGTRVMCVSPAETIISSIKERIKDKPKKEVASQSPLPLIFFAKKNRTKKDKIGKKKIKRASRDAVSGA